MDKPHIIYRLEYEGRGIYYGSKADEDWWEPISRLSILKKHGVYKEDKLSYPTLEEDEELKKCLKLQLNQEFLKLSGDLIFGFPSWNTMLNWFHYESIKELFTLPGFTIKVIEVEPQRLYAVSRFQCIFDSKYNRVIKELKTIHDFEWYNGF